MRKHPYRLHAAFFHRGSAGGGHYWVYIYDHKKEIWRKYNDERVSVVSNTNEIFGNPYGTSQQQQPTASNPAPNPYLLIYLDADKIDALAETVKRDPVYPPPDQPPPIPARNPGPHQSQMSAMPPTQGGEEHGDVEMLEFVNGGEHALSEEIMIHPPESRIKKVGDWDDSELIADSAIKW